jgi:glycosyltransferase involved in cell wall biosynthesis
MYGSDYSVIQNMPILKPLIIPGKKEKVILYQGAVNEGRSLETLIPAFKNIPARLEIFGDGNFMEQARRLVENNYLQEKVIFNGKVLPDELQARTRKAWIGTTLFENKGLSNFYSLGNRFFDYIHAGIPQLCVDYPCYREINKKIEVAVLIDDLSTENISAAINKMLDDQQLYHRLQQNCLKAREELNWQQEEKKLIAFYRKKIPVSSV